MLQVRVTETAIAGEPTLRNEIVASAGEPATVRVRIGSYECNAQVIGDISAVETRDTMTLTFELREILS